MTTDEEKPLLECTIEQLYARCPGVLVCVKTKAGGMMCITNGDLSGMSGLVRDCIAENLKEQRAKKDTNG